ncbi:hypothetical protein HDK90DRAFT_695 [Phyllosticta capitalensis]|uniref:Uncharacterized protein n=1 Tax=Phyllosticta capitalensis TaxID=121624 RepID=A0ABR1Z1A1_9PEZI
MDAQLQRRSSRRSLGPPTTATSPDLANSPPLVQYHSAPAHQASSVASPKKNHSPADIVSAADHGQARSASEPHNPRLSPRAQEPLQDNARHGQRDAGKVRQNRARSLPAAGTPAQARSGRQPRAVAHGADDSRAQGAFHLRPRSGRRHFEEGGGEAAERAADAARQNDADVRLGGAGPTRGEGHGAAAASQSKGPQSQARFEERFRR